MNETIVGIVRTPVLTTRQEIDFYEFLESDRKNDFDPDR